MPITHTLLFKLTGHTDRVTTVAFSAEGRRLASGSADNTVQLWDIGKGQLIRVFQDGMNDVHRLAFSPDGKLLAVGGRRFVWLWDVESGQRLRTLDGHKGLVHILAFGADGKGLMSGAYDKTSCLWDVETGQLLQSEKMGTSFLLAHFTPSPDGRLFACQSAENAEDVWVWNQRGGELLHTLKGHTAPVQDFAFSQDARWLASGGDDAAVWLWDTATGQPLLTLEGFHIGRVNSVALSSDNHLLASGGNDKLVCVWRLAKS